MAISEDSSPATLDPRLQSPSLFPALLESAPDGVVLVDEDGHIVLTNNQTQELFGYSPSELYQQPIELLIPERFRPQHTGDRQRYSERPKRRPMGTGLELYGRRKDGSEFPVEVSLSPIQTGDSHLTLAFVRDISERKAHELAARALQEIQLAHTEHLATLGEIAAGLAHEIKNPLAGIAAGLEVLAGDCQRKFALDPALGDLMNELQAQVQRIKITVDELLNYARPKPLRRSAGDLNLCIEHVVHFARRQATARGVELSFQSEALPLLNHDPDQIQRMVLNLLLNAIDAVGRGGAVQVRTRAHDGEAVIEVQDNGPGIPATDLERIFRPFFTTKGGGTGLGLSLCRRIAEMHHGMISAESQPGQGSLFRVRIPLVG